MKRILTGIQPTGILHLGNYFGAMRPAIALQEEGEAFYFIADYHALTTVQDPAKLREYNRAVALDFLACGLDPARACFFLQSDVPQVTELAWILSTVTPMGLLERAHSYKDKIAHGIAASHGLFAYPVLMAADILLYDSDVVPVGKDQKQHLEITRDLVVKFNETYGEVFKLPEPRIQEHTAIVPGLDGQKMSKSYDNTIEIFADEKAIQEKDHGAGDGFHPRRSAQGPGRFDDPRVVPARRLSPEDAAKMEDEFRAGGVGYGDFKKRLFGAVWEYFAPMRKRREEILAEKGYVDDVLAHGARQARAAASHVMQRVRKAVGLREQP